MNSAIDKILSDEFEIAEGKVQNQPIYDFSIDYSAILRDHEEAIIRWKELGDKQSDYARGLPSFLDEEKVRNPKDQEFHKAKSAYLVSEEVKKRIEVASPLKPLPLDSIDYQSSLAELVESIENADQIKSLYKLRKITTGNSKNAGISMSESVKLKNCFSQGRELYFAGRGGSLMVKPLNHFYAITAYSYGMIVLNNPIRYSKDNLPSSHGMQYLPDAVQCQFGGDSPTGTFSELFCSFPTQLIRTQNIEFTQDYQESIKSFFTTRINAREVVAEFRTSS